MTTAVFLGTSEEGPIEDRLEYIRPLLLRYALYRIRTCYEFNAIDDHRDLAEDLIQVTFERVAKNFYRYDPTKAKFRTWVYVIFNRLFSNATRDSKRLRQLMRLSARFSDRHLGASNHVQADEELEKVEFYSTLTQALEDIPSIMKEIFMLREFEQLEYEEISSRLHIPIGTVKSRLFRAKEYLAADPRVQALRS